MRRAVSPSIARDMVKSEQKQPFRCFVKVIFSCASRFIACCNTGTALLTGINNISGSSFERQV